MKRLRHPITSIREPFGKAGLIVACLALVAALGGTALAAKHLFTKAQEKQIAKIAKKYAGKAGPAGTAGATGPQGAPGAPGAAGKDGTPGINGKAVTVSKIDPETLGCNELGGALVKQEGAATGVEVCNGKAGEAGAIHPGETLPKGASETGSWGFSAHTEGYVVEKFSFPVPLKHALSEENIGFVFSDGKEACAEGTGCTEGKRTPTICLGSPAEPTAPEGHLCIYEQFAVGTFVGPNFGFSYPGGADGLFIVPTTTPEAGAVIPGPGVLALGSWSVTSGE